MIDLKVSGNNYELTDKIIEYAGEKIGRLEKYLPKGARDGVSGNVTLTLDQSGREDNQCICEVIIPVRGTTLQAKEATMNMFAAVDIAEAKIKAQIIKYKQKHSPKQNQAKRFVFKLLRKGVEE